MPRKYGLWAAQALVALVLIPAGAAKLAGVPAMHVSFAVLGLPGWFGYFIGACEVAGAVGIFIPALGVLAASGISVIMLGAMYYHATHPPLALGIPALIVLLLCVYVAGVRRRLANAP